MRGLMVAIVAAAAVTASGAHASPFVLFSGNVPDENHNLDLFADNLPRGYYQFTTAATLVGGDINLGMRYTEEFEGDNNGQVGFAGFQDAQGYPDLLSYDRDAHSITWHMTAPADVFGDPPGYVRPPGECQNIPVYGFLMCNWVYIAEYHLQIIGANLTFAPGGDSQTWQLLYSETPFTAVPEPAEWALLIAGFGGAGAALRRRRAVALRA